MVKKTEIETRRMFQELDVLLILDGGCAPGYNPVTAFITYHLEGIGREAYATREGFKSLVSGKDIDFVRLVYDPELLKKLDLVAKKTNPPDFLIPKIVCKNNLSGNTAECPARILTYFLD